MNAATLSIHRVTSVRLKRAEHSAAGRVDAFHTLDVVLTTEEGNEVLLTAFSDAPLDVVEDEASASRVELIEALIDLHTVAHVDRDEDYAAITNAAAVIAKATGSAS